MINFNWFLIQISYFIYVFFSDNNFIGQWTNFLFVSRDIKELDGRVKTLTEYIIEGKLHKKKTCTMKKSMKNKNTNGLWPSF